MPEIPGLSGPFPGYHYVGPGNHGYGVPPSGELDAFARDHDLAYEHSPLWGPLTVLSDLSVAEADGVLALRAAELAVGGGNAAGPGERMLAFLTAGLFGTVSAGKYVVLGVVPGLGHIVQRAPNEPGVPMAAEDEIIQLEQGRLTAKNYIDRGRDRVFLWTVIRPDGRQQLCIGPIAAIEDNVDGGLIRDAQEGPAPTALQIQQYLDRTEGENFTWGAGLLVPLAWLNVASNTGPAANENLVLDQLVRVNDAIETQRQFVTLRAPTAAQILANQAAYDYLNSLRESGKVTIPFAASYGFTVSKVNAKLWNVNIDGIAAISFSTMAQAQNVAKKGNALLRRVVRTSLAIAGTGSGDGINQFVLDGQNPINNFDPPLVIGS